MEPQTLSSIVVAALGGLVGWMFSTLGAFIGRQTDFGHRSRLEKEYNLYVDLWDKLFDVRRDTAARVEPLHTDGQADKPHERMIDSFNAFQSVVRRGEPFMHISVYGPARDVVVIVRRVAFALARIKRIQKQRQAERNLERDERFAESQIELEDETLAALTKIEAKYRQIRKAIRRRIEPDHVGLWHRVSRSKCVRRTRSAVVRAWHSVQSAGEW